MNFLPLVFIFLMIYGAFSLHFLTSSKMEQTEKEGYLGRIRATRLAYNENEDVIYHDLYKKSKNQEKLASQKTKNFKEDPKDKQIYFRVKRLGSKYGAINLAHYITNPNPFLYKLTLRYLKCVYSHAFFYDDPNLAKSLLDFILAEQKKSWEKTQTFIKLEELKPTGTLKECYGKFIRGTNSFNPENKEGYLPLNLCVAFNTATHPPINFHFANTALLTILFGKEGRIKIEATEWPNGYARKNHDHQKKYALKKEELCKLFEKNLSDELLNLLDDTFHPDYKSPKRCVDQKTNIAAQINES